MVKVTGIESQVGLAEEITVIALLDVQICIVSEVIVCRCSTSHVGIFCRSQVTGRCNSIAAR